MAIQHHPARDFRPVEDSGDATFAGRGRFLVRARLLKRLEASG
jgi:hypothetical protein